MTVLATRGARALTHRAVDRQAGVPAGSTSNVFRTKASLIAGVLGYLTDRELQALPALAANAHDTTVDERTLTDMAALAIADALGPGRQFTAARKALFLEASADLQTRQRLAEASRFWWQTVTPLLIAAGVPEPEQRSRWLLAYIDGVIADQLARPDSDFDARAAIAPAIHGIVTTPPGVT